MKRLGRKPNPNKPDAETLAAEIEMMTAKEIGDKYGVCESTIWRWLREYRTQEEAKK